MADDARHDDGLCIGFGETEGRCENLPDLEANESGLWCGECEHARRQHLDTRFKELGVDLAKLGERR